MDIGDQSHELSKQLRHILAPHFLRREKKDVFNTNGGASKGEGGQSSPSQSSSEERQKQALTTRMNDFIVWLSLNPVRRHFPNKLHLPVAHPMCARASATTGSGDALPQLPRIGPGQKRAGHDQERARGFGPAEKALRPPSSSHGQER